MELTEHRCSRCGAELIQQSDTRWRCKYCGCTYDDSTAMQNAKSMQDMFDEAKRELINNLRRNLYDATNAEYISSVDVKNACIELKKYLPDDFRANFYEIAVGNNLKKLTHAIRKIDVDANRDEIDTVIRFLTKSLQHEFLLDLNNLVEQAYKGRDLQKFEQLATEIAEQAEKVQQGVYETKLPREVFVAYSSKDMSYVTELVEVLESQGLKCFVAARNLRHGKGAVENYDKALKEAIDYCRSVVFVSTPNSRSFSCDALEIELPYIHKQDIENAPAEYRNHYTAIPHRYKKPRVEYRVEGSKGFNAADEIAKEFFDGYEWALSPSEVAVRIMKQLVEVEDNPEPAVLPLTGHKYCAHCGDETELNKKFCSTCGKGDFTDTLEEYLKLKTQRELEERRSREEELAEEDAVVLEKKKTGCAVFFVLLLLVGMIGGGAYAGAKIGIFDFGNLFPVDTEKPHEETTEHVENTTAEIDRPDTNEPASDEFSDSQAFESTSDESSSSQASESKNEETTEDVIEFEPTEGLAYTLADNGKAYAVSGIGSYSGVHVTIPATYSGLPVTSIAESAFQNCSELNTVIIPESVTKIGSHAFDGCAALTNVNIPEACSEIAGYAFFSCTSLESIRIPANVAKIGERAFANCDNLTGLSVDVNNFTFHVSGNCLIETASKKLIAGFSNSVIPADGSVISIEAYAFSNCDGLTAIKIPASVTSVADIAFWGCINLAEIQVDAGNTAYHVSGNCLIDTARKILVAGCANSVIPADGSVTSIGNHAFFFRVELESITIPNNITAIGDFAFRNCINLKNITIPDSVESIGSGAFYQCIALTELTIPDSVTIIGSDAFLGCSELESVEIKGNIESIAPYTFENCYKLKSITIPASVKNIGSNAFSSCRELQSIIFGGTPEQWLSVEKGENWNTDTGSFYIYFESGSEEVKTVIVDAQSMLDSANRYVGMSGTFGAAILSDDGKYVSLYGNDQLEAYFTPYTYNHIDSKANYLFYKYRYDANNPSAIGNVDIFLSSKDTIAHGDDYFRFEVTGDGEWHVVIIDLNSVTTNKGVFNDQGECVPLYVRLDLLNWRSTIEDRVDIAYFGLGADLADIFRYVTAEDSVATMVTQNAQGDKQYTDYNTANGSVADPSTPDADEPDLSSPTEGLAYTLADSGDAYAVSGIGSYSGVHVTIPATYNGLPVTEIGDNAFKECTSLTSVTIPESVVRIGYNAFNACENLTSIVIPEGVKSISIQAFFKCFNLSEVVLPNSLEEIHVMAFSLCTNLRSIVIPAGVTYIHEQSFMSAGIEHFQIDSGNTVYHVTGNCVIKTESKELIMGFSNSTIPADGSVTRIGNSAFMNGDLTSITIPETVTSIGDSAFAQCAALATITFQGTPTQWDAIEKETNWNDGIDSYDVICEIKEALLITAEELESSRSFSFSDTVLSTDGSYVSFYGCNYPESAVLPELTQSINTRYLYYQYRYDAANPSTVGDSVEIFLSSTSSSIKEGDNIRFKPICDGEWHLVVFDLYSVTTTNGLLNEEGECVPLYLRLDLINWRSTAQDRVDVAFVGFDSDLDRIFSDATGIIETAIVITQDENGNKVYTEFFTSDGVAVVSP